MRSLFHEVHSRLPLSDVFNLSRYKYTDECLTIFRHPLSRTILNKSPNSKRRPVGFPIGISRFNTLSLLAFRPICFYFFHSQSTRLFSSFFRLIVKWMCAKHIVNDRHRERATSFEFVWNLDSRSPQGKQHSVSWHLRSRCLHSVPNRSFFFVSFVHNSNPCTILRNIMQTSHCTFRSLNLLQVEYEISFQFFILLLAWIFHLSLGFLLHKKLLRSHSATRSLFYSLYVPFLHIIRVLGKFIRFYSLA